jgi:hypothetical protein
MWSKLDQLFRNRDGIPKGKLDVTGGITLALNLDHEKRTSVH